MNKSESITKLATALAKVQAEMTVAPLNAKNPFLKNEYADLGSIINTAKPVIAKHGISVAQFPISNGNMVGIETILMHESGEWMSNELNLELTSEKGKSAAQVAGSIISYLRRYSYASVLGMYSGDDNDGHSEPKPTPKAQPEPSGKMVRPMNAMQTKSAILGKAKKYETQNRTVTDKQDKMFSAIWLSLFDDQKDRYAVTEWLFNITSSNDITDSQKLALIDWLSLEKDDNNHFVPSNDAIRERSNMVSAVMKEQGQLEFAA